MEWEQITPDHVPPKIFFSSMQFVLAVSDVYLHVISSQCSRGEVGQDGQNGLVKGHGYGITDVKEIKLNKGMKAALGADILHLVRLKNPWGTREWTGAWSDE